MNPTWDWGFALSILPQLLAATGVSLFAALASFVAAMLIALPLAVARDLHNRTVRIAIGAFVEFVRSTPVLIQIYVLYFTLPQFGIVMPELLTGVIALSVHYATYVCEAYRAGLQSVGSGTREAASALGLRPMTAFFKVVLPQAIAPIVPALGNYLIAIYKETPLLSAIAIIELLQTAKLIGSESFRYTEPVTLVGLIFLALSLASAQLIRVVERRSARWRGS